MAISNNKGGLFGSAEDRIPEEEASTPPHFKFTPGDYTLLL